MWARAVVVPAFITARPADHPGDSTRLLLIDSAYRVDLPVGSPEHFRRALSSGRLPAVHSPGGPIARRRSTGAPLTQRGAGRAILSWRSHDTTGGLTCRCTGRHRGARARAPRARGAILGSRVPPVNGGSLDRQLKDQSFLLVARAVVVPHFHHGRPSRAELLRASGRLPRHAARHHARARSSISGGSQFRPAPCRAFSRRAHRAPVIG